MVIKANNNKKYSFFGKKKSKSIKSDLACNSIFVKKILLMDRNII
jgi:hypothetical protein